MQVITDKPFPLLDRVQKAFPVPPNAVFAYGEDLYAPIGANITLDLMMHEATHAVQQSAGAEIWWERYLTDDAFRLAQEVQAYRAQYAFFCASHKDRNTQARFLHRIATDLASPLYGNLCPFSEAYKLIKT